MNAAPDDRCPRLALAVAASFLSALAVGLVGSLVPPSYATLRLALFVLGVVALLAFLATGAAYTVFFLRRVARTSR